MTGLNGFKDKKTADLIKRHFRAMPGASGGPVTDKDGNVVGEIVTATKDDTYLGGDLIKALYDIEFPGATYGDETGFEPASSNIVPSFYITQALNSPKIA